MEYLLDLLMGRGFSQPRSKHILGFRDQLFLPLLDLIGMDIKVLRSFGQGALPLHGG